MANEEQLSILKQGVKVWNEWKRAKFFVTIDLRDADLRDADFSAIDLSGVNLSGANLFLSNLRGANLDGANLDGANLSAASLSGTSLIGADLRRANLSAAGLVGANLREANLSGANLLLSDLREAHLSAADLSEARLSKANLSKTYLSKANLSRANFSEANVSETNLSGANLIGSKFSTAKVDAAIFGNLDLSEAIGLEDVYHGGPSSISTDTLALSKGKIHKVFLRGCGLSDWEIEAAKLYNPDLTNHEINDIQYRMYDLRATQAIQISPLFISYSHANGEFVDKVGNYLTKKGVRFWRDIHDMKSGRMEKQIDRAIRQNPTVLLVLSEHSLSSDWVEHEVRTARALEKEMGRDILCPVALDDSWKGSRWPKRVMEQIMEYNILDFSAWEDDVKFEGMFRKLIDGLELFYKG